MRRVSYQQYAIIQEETAELLTERLNLKLKELRDQNPKVSFDGLTARICYTVEEETEGTATDGTEDFKLNLKCRDCPIFEPIRKKDGTADRRMAIGFCPLAEDGHTLTTARACKKLFRMINDKEVRLCLKEE